MTTPSTINLPMSQPKRKSKFSLVVVSTGLVWFYMLVMFLGAWTTLPSRRAALEEAMELASTLPHWNNESPIHRSSSSQLGDNNLLSGRPSSRNLQSIGPSTMHQHHDKKNDVAQQRALRRERAMQEIVESATAHLQPSRPNPPHPASRTSSDLRSSHHRTAFPPPWTPVRSEDLIYQHLRTWSNAPIVIQDYKLILFVIPKVGCTQWKKMARRMMGYEDWKTADAHNPKSNGLRYLYDYSLSNATYMMNAPEWTRAVTVRDPKERFLSAYLDKAVGKGGYFVQNQCCPTGRRRNHKRLRDETSSCWNPHRHTFADFVALTQSCSNPHWDPQHDGIPQKYLPLLNFVGHLETVADDSKALLTKLGAWEDIGATGWGPDGTEAIFASTNDVQHKTKDKSKSYDKRLSAYYTPALENILERRFAEDYNLTAYGLPLKHVNYPPKSWLEWLFGY